MDVGENARVLHLHAVLGFTEFSYIATGVSVKFSFLISLHDVLLFQVDRRYSQIK